MVLHLKEGIGKLRYGMRRKDVEEMYGRPDAEFTDDEGNAIWLYNAEKLRLTFYEDEDFRFGYLICSHPEIELLGGRVVGKNFDEVAAGLKVKGLEQWEKEAFDLTVNHFNESNWLILQSEFGEITKVEAGAIINDKDEFEWKFK